MRSLDDLLQSNVTTREAMTLRSALRGYIPYWVDHAAEDQFASHSLEDLQAVRIEAGRLIWRLEEATAPPGGTLTHSADLVPPDPGEGG